MLDTWIGFLNICNGPTETVQSFALKIRSLWISIVY